MSTYTVSDPVRARNKLGLTTRRKGAFHPDTLDARRELVVSKIAAYVERVVGEAPPLTDEQRDRLAVLLRSTGRRPSDSDEAA